MVVQVAPLPPPVPASLDHKDTVTEIATKNTPNFRYIWLLISGFWAQYAEARCYPPKKMPRFWLQIQKIQNDWSKKIVLKKKNADFIIQKCFQNFKFWKKR